MEPFPLKNQNNFYQLIDSGDGERLEQFGPYKIARPCSRALWPKKTQWKAESSFTREDKKGWLGKSLPNNWEIEINNLRFELQPTDFGHLGVFPEHHLRWQEMDPNKGDRVLNLFAYTGATSLYMAKKQALVTHVDASQVAIDWAKKNATLNQIDTVRWILDDVMKFLKREIRREKKYEWIIVDPPTFGRGAQGQVFKIEEQINELLELCAKLLSENPRGVLLSSHTLELTPAILERLLQRSMPNGQITSGENILEATSGTSLPLGTYAWWKP